MLYEEQDTNIVVYSIHDELYLNISSMKTVHRLHWSAFDQDEQLDGRSMLISASYRHLFSTPKDLIKTTELLKITFTGTFTNRTAKQLLTDSWQRFLRPTSLSVQIHVMKLEEYWIASIR